MFVRMLKIGTHQECKKKKITIANTLQAKVGRAPFLHNVTMTTAFCRAR